MQNGKVIQEVPLQYAGKKSTFAGQIPLTAAGPLELEVLALDPPTANFGTVRRRVVVTP